MKKLWCWSVEIGNILDSWGIASTLTRDKKAAIENFELYIKSTNKYKEKTQRQCWINGLRAGESPFTKEMRRLLNE